MFLTKLLIPCATFVATRASGAFISKVMGFKDGNNTEKNIQTVFKGASILTTTVCAFFEAFAFASTGGIIGPLFYLLCGGAGFTLAVMANKSEFLSKVCESLGKGTYYVTEILCSVTKFLWDTTSSTAKVIYDFCISSNTNEQKNEPDSVQSTGETTGTEEQS